MLYNIEKNRPKRDSDCLSCQYFNAEQNCCNGMNKNCFAYDKKTGTLIDGITKLPLKKI